MSGLIACSHSQPAVQTKPMASSEPGAATPSVEDDAQVDPTLPSWAPRSCSGYHRAVVQALACDAIAQPTRELIKKTYEERHASWQAVEDAPQGKIAEIGKQCTTDAELVRAEAKGKCTP